MQNNMNNIIGLIIALLVIGGGYWYYNSNQSDQLSAQNTAEVMVKDAADRVEEDVMMKKDEDAKMEKHSQDELLMSKEEEAAMMKKEEDVMMKKEEEVMVKEETVMEKKEEPAPAPVSQAPGTFSSYSAGKVASADGDVVVAFLADWCPTCRVLERDIEASLGDIPSDLTILKANYDTESDLKKKYGVTYQHTFVQVDNNGNLVQKWGGGNTLESVVSRVN